MMGNQQPLFNDRYPDDIIHLILMQVDILTLTSCPHVCRQFTRVLRSQYFWKCKVAVDFGPKPKINPDGWSQDHPSGADPTGTAMDEDRDFRRQVFRLVNSPNRKIVTTYAISESLRSPIIRISKEKERASWELRNFVSLLCLRLSIYEEENREYYQYYIYKSHDYQFDLMKILN